MKRTGLNTWGSDILLMKPTLSIDLLKRLLLLAIKAFTFLQISYMTEILSSSLHRWVKKSKLAFLWEMTKRKPGYVFHIIEQVNRKSTAAVNKNYREKGLYRFETILYVPYYGTMNNNSL